MCVAQEYVFNTFAFGYAIGYHFIERATGSMNGNFLGIGADLMTNSSVQVEQSQPMVPYTEVEQRRRVVDMLGLRCGCGDCEKVHIA